jgi:hypothetical protein
MPDTHDEDQQPQPSTSVLEAAMQDHPIVALLAAALIGVLLAKMAF